MLRDIDSSDSRFKSVRFKPGFNLIVAETTLSAAETDSRNSVGKSSLIELIHFLLGSDLGQSSSLAKAALRDSSFTMRMDWPRVSDVIAITRSLSRPSHIRLEPDISRERSSRELFPRSTEVSVAEWRDLIESDLFSLPAEHTGLSGRTMLSFLARRASSKAFNSATKTYPQQSQTDAATNLAYLFGLDWQQVAEYRDLATAESTRKKLIRASKDDPTMGRIIGNTAMLRSEIVVQERRVEELRERVQNFRVIAEFEAKQNRVDELQMEVRRIQIDEAADRRNLQEVQNRSQSAPDTFEIGYVEKAFADLQVLLGEQVRREFDAVRDFHESIVANRSRYLADEEAEIRRRLSENLFRREQLGEEMARLLNELNTGGALSALAVLQSDMSREEGTLAVLRSRFEAAAMLEARKSEIAAARANLQNRLLRDLAARSSALDEAVLLFTSFASSLYGDDRRTNLLFDPRPTALKIEPHIPGDAGGGVGNMVIFCFDLTLVVLAHRAGRGPDFLIHDSHLFDGVDARQVARALNLARTVATNEGIQYITTFNSDDLEKATGEGFDANDDAIQPKLTDAYEAGGLFGFRFD